MACLGEKEGWERREKEGEEGEERSLEGEGKDEGDRQVEKIRPRGRRRKCPAQGRKEAGECSAQGRIMV